MDNKTISEEERKEFKRVEKLKNINKTSPVYLLKVFLAAGLASSTATAIVNPLELIKTRIQTTQVNDSIINVVRNIIAKEGGIHKLWTIGLGVSFTRSLLYSSVRIGVYDPVKEVITKIINNYKIGSTNTEVVHQNTSKDLPLFWKAFAGLISGAIGSALMNPLDVVKIRFQSSGMTGQTGLNNQQPIVYKNTLDALMKIIKTEGILSLYKGTTITVLRASALTSAQLSSYEQAKYLFIEKLNFDRESTSTHISSALVSGLFTAITISPFDVIKTRYMNDIKLKKNLTNGGSQFNGIFDCVVKSVRKEGPLVLFKGFLPSYARLGPHFLLSLPLYEQFRKLFGVDSL
ncbi:hypothetical protein ABK040_011162 [Willaertia magna]